MFKNLSFHSLSLCLIALFIFVSCKSNSEINSSSTDIVNEGHILTNIWAMFQDSKGNIWFGGDENSSSYYDGTQLHKLDIPETLFRGRVLGFQEDKQGNIYFDTTDGVCKYDGTKFEMLPISDITIEQVDWTLNPEDLWFRMGFDKNGAYVYDGEELHFMHFFPTEYSEAFFQRNPLASHSPFGLYEIYRDKNGDIWFGTASAGVGRYDGESVSWLYQDKMTNTPSGGSLGIRSILHDKNDKFWFTNFREVYAIDENPIMKDGAAYLDFTATNGMPSIPQAALESYPYFQSLKEDAEGNLWAASYSQGIFKKTPTEIISYKVQQNGVDATVFALFIDKDDGVWAMSHEAGIYKFDGTGFTPFHFKL